MSLNNIELGDLIVSELYRDNLLATEARPASEKPRPATAVPKSTPAVDPPPMATPVPVAPPIAAPVTAAPQPLPQGQSPVNPDPGTSSAAPLPQGPGAPVASASPHSGSPASPGYKFLGNNRRKITILVQSPGVAFLPDDQLNFLTRMLEACKMNVGDVAIVNRANTPVTITALKQQLQPAVLLLFGMEPTQIQLPMNFPPFKIQPYDECTYLCAPSLEELVLPGDESKLLKSKLWICLKTLFEI